MDFRGFGQSSRPKEMAGAPYLHKPVVHVNDATKDVATVINWIKKEKKRKQNSSCWLVIWRSGSWKLCHHTPS
jgi:hypothetical protein